MRRVAIIQARIGSQRLPGKVLMDISGRSMLAHVINRVSGCETIDAVIVATSDRTQDDAVAAAAHSEGVVVVRGSESDVLSRYALAARSVEADVVVRVTADCPLLDPTVVDRVVRALDVDVDYAANVIERSYPRGLDVEAMHGDVVARMNRMARSAAAREHVTRLIWEQPDRFVTRSVVDDLCDNSDLRWTVDTEADLALVRRLYRDLGLSPHRCDYSDVVRHVRENPSLVWINGHVRQAQV